MTIRILTIEEIRDVYYRFMIKDFPDNERKPLNMIEHALKKQEYTCLGIFDNEDILGYGFFAVNGDYYLLDYLAVRFDKRDQGIGSAFILRLSEMIPRAAGILCEVENPDYAETDEERIIREKRLSFYIRNGFVGTEVTAWLFGVEYRIIELPVQKVHSNEEIIEIYQDLSRMMLGTVLSKKMLKFHPIPTEKTQ